MSVKRVIHPERCNTMMINDIAIFEKLQKSENRPRFHFYKGAEDVIAIDNGKAFDWTKAASQVREHLNDALNAKHLSFLFGSGCSSLKRGTSNELGIPTMAPLAAEFLRSQPSLKERETLSKHLGFYLNAEAYRLNLERLMEALYSFQFVLTQSSNQEIAKGKEAIDSLIEKIIRFVTQTCSKRELLNDDSALVNLYQAFYRKLIYRDRTLPRPWIFTTNYDLFNEIAMDRLGIPYCNGFSGTIERRFNPSTYRYALAEQLDLTCNKWTAVDNFVYLCKLHGSINWIEKGESCLFPIQEVSVSSVPENGRVMIYPTPMKQNTSFGSPYSDLFREFQTRIVREQSVLFVLGYGFGDEHVNNIIYQALTIPTFRLIALLPPDKDGIPQRLKALNDPRIWLIGDDGPVNNSSAHYFDTFVEEFMPEIPSEKISTAIKKVFQEFISPKAEAITSEVPDNDY